MTPASHNNISTVQDRTSRTTKLSETTNVGDTVNMGPVENLLDMCAVLWFELFQRYISNERP